MKLVLLVFLMMSGVGFSQGESSAVLISTDKSSYKNGEVVSVVVTGTVKTTGGCTAKPMLGIMVKTKAGWEYLIDPDQPQMDCGLASMSCDHDTFKVLKVGERWPVLLKGGKYKVVAVGLEGKVYESNIFSVNI